MNHNSNMNAGGESDGRVLPGKHPNKDGKSSAEGSFSSIESGIDGSFA
jgi:hypothetical protein